MLLLYILLLGMLAAFTAYVRHLQSTVITLEQQIPARDRDAVRRLVEGGGAGGRRFFAAGAGDRLAHAAADVGALRRTDQGPTSSGAWPKAPGTGARPRSSGASSRGST
jgi:hypothetical protein